MTGVPDIEELSIADPSDWVSDDAPRATLDFLLFAIGASLILVFTALNIYSLPLGTVSPDSVYEDAGALYGSQVEVFGIISHSNQQEFTLSLENSSTVLEVVWLGDKSLPINGTAVVATGQIIQGTVGPAMMCGSLTTKVGQFTYYEDPWALPAIRMLSTVMLWALFMLFSTGLLSLIHMHRRTEEERHLMTAMTGVCTLSTGALVAGIAALIISEPSLGGSVGISFICAAVAFAFLLISSIARHSKRANIAEIANPLPVIAAITMLLGLLVPFISIQMAPEVSIISEMIERLPEFAAAAALGTSGLILTGTYIVRRRSELSAIESAQPAEARRGG